MKYISLLRGINVSGQKKIKMTDLQTLYQKLHLEDVITYIQTGNVIFTSDIKNKAQLSNKIEQAIKDKYRFHVPVELRTRQELGKIIEHCPFGPVDLQRDGTSVLVTFLSEKPLKSSFEEVKKYASVSEKIVLKGQEVYLYCPNGYGKSKLANSLLEKKLGVNATTRNWKSVINLHELSK